MTTSALDCPRAHKARRGRPTSAATIELDAALMALIERAGPPCTARQVFYMAVGAGLLDKDDAAYRKVIRRLSAMREAEVLPWSYIADNTRWVRQREQYADLEEALGQWQAAYRRDYWRSQPKRLEVWVESDSIRSFLDEVVTPYGVPLFTCRGQASKTYIRGAAEVAQEIGKPVEILFIGDFDPTGLAIDRSVEERYGRYSDVHLRLTRVGVTAEHIVRLGLLGTSTKRSDPNFQRFAATCAAHDLPVMSYETEAIEPRLLRGIVRDAIEEQIDWDRWAAVADYERAERAQLAAMLGGAR